MTTMGGLLPAGEVLAGVEALLDRLDPDRSSVSAVDRLSWVRVARRVRGRVEALTGVLMAEADRAKASQVAAGTPMASWLGMGETVSRREAAGALRQARSLAEHRLVGEAALAGRVVPGQARAITTVLDGLAGQLDTAQQALAEQVLVELAGQLDADQLAKSAARVLSVVVPERAGEVLAERLQREAEVAHRQRALRFFRDGASVRFDGSLPKVAAEQWIAHLDALAETSRRTALERRDPLATPLTPEQRRADALIALIEQSASSGGGGGGPTARVLVRLDYNQLVAGAADAGVLGDGTPLSAGELRRLCCDAEVIPVVLGAPSAVLDVGRASRLVTPELRAALAARGTAAVCSPAATRHPRPVRPTTWCPGSRAGRPPCGTWSCCATPTTRQWSRPGTVSGTSGRSGSPRTATPNTSHPPASTPPAPRSATTDTRTPPPTTPAPQPPPDGRTGGPADRRADGPTGRRADRRTGGRADGPTGRRTDGRAGP